jgi:hypothetical protein
MTKNNTVAPFLNSSGPRKDSFPWTKALRGNHKRHCLKPRVPLENCRSYDDCHFFLLRFFHNCISASIMPSTSLAVHRLTLQQATG